MNSRSATSELLHPAAISVRTSTSRSLRPGRSSSALARLVTGLGQHGHGGVVIEPTCFGVCHQLARRLVGSDRRAMGAGLQHGGEGISGGDEACAERDCNSGAAPVVAGPVEALVVHADQDRDRFQ